MRKREKNDNLYKFSLQTPWQFIIVVLLYTAGAVGFPESIFTYFLGEGVQGQAIARFLSRVICSTLLIWLIFEIKAQKIFLLKNFFYKFLLIIPFVLVAVNNFPIIPLSSKEVEFVSENNDFATWICYLLADFGGVFLEEIAFRGLVFTVLYRKFQGNKNQLFYSVLLSSLMFGAMHLFNLLAGANIGAVIMQVGYSILIGGMCAIAFVLTGNFYNALLLHFIFNVGGLLYDYNMISGNIWTIENILVTAILAVIVIVYALIMLFRCKKSPLNDKILRLDKEDERSN